MLVFFYFDELMKIAMITTHLCDEPEIPPVTPEQHRNKP